MTWPHRKAIASLSLYLFYEYREDSRPLLSVFKAIVFLQEREKIWFTGLFWQRPTVDISRLNWGVVKMTIFTLSDHCPVPFPFSLNCVNNIVKSKYSDRLDCVSWCCCCRCCLTACVFPCVSVYTLNKWIFVTPFACENFNQHSCFFLSLSLTLWKQN